MFVSNHTGWLTIAAIALLTLLSPAWADNQAQSQGSDAAFVGPQDKSAGADVQTLQPVIVTGSLLRMTVDQQKALPLSTLSATALQDLNATTPQAAVGLLAQNQYAAQSNTSLGAGTAFASYADLRSLGSQRTLVLFDGQRVSDDPYQDAGVNLNTLPLALLDRVEVLADGASALYGSDAIAGVVNFIPKQQFSGLDLSVSGTEPQLKGGGGSTYASAAAGLGSLESDHWNLYVGGTWHRQSALAQADRSFTDDAYLPGAGYNRLASTAFPGNYTQKGTIASAVNPSFPTCNPPISIPDGGIFGANSCGINTPADGTDAIPQDIQYSGIVRGTVKFGDERVTLQYFRAYDDLNDTLAPNALNGVPMTPNNPYFPGEGITPGTPGLNPAIPITVYFRLQAAGFNRSEVLNVTDRLDAKLEGHLLGWSYSLWALRSLSTVDLSFDSGQVNIPAIENGLTGAGGAPFLNPFGAQSAAGQAYIDENMLTGPMQYGRSELDMAGAQIGRDIFDLPAGPVALALATAGRYDHLSFVSSPLVAEAIGSGISSQNVSGHRTDVSVTGELNVPIVNHLDLDTSGRFDRYSDVGDTANPNVSLRYRPVQRLVLRASFGMGFFAPTLFNVDAPDSYPATSARNNDPVLCPGGVPNLAAGAEPVRDCNALFPVKTGGNPNLQPEKSTNYSFGGVFQLTRRASVGVDYYNYLVEDTIGTLTNSTILGNGGKYGDLIVRCSDVPASVLPALTTCKDTAGNPIAYTVGTVLNLGDTRTSGLDLTAELSGAETRVGTFAFDYRGTYVLQYRTQLQPQGSFVSQDGQYANGFPVIRYSHLATASWRVRHWSAQLSNRFESGYDDCNGACAIAPAYFKYVGSYSLWDISVGYTGIRNLSVKFLVANLFNTDPPFTNKNTGLGFGYDERFTDPLGRAFTLSAAYSIGASK
jgi:iron complex outermembrane receptor protein